MEKYPIKLNNSPQLFVDDYLIEDMSSLGKSLHTVEKHKANPLLIPEFPFEKKYKYHYIVDNGTVIYDDRANIFRAYFSQAQKNTLYAESQDGIKWEKPFINKYTYAGSKKNNILLEDIYCCSVMYDPGNEGKPPFRMYALKRGVGPFVLWSENGIDWKGEPASCDKTGRGDNACCVYDPFTKTNILISKVRYPIGKIVINPLMDNVWEIPVRVLGCRTCNREMNKWSAWREILRPDERDHKIAEERYPAISVEGFLYPWRMRAEFEGAHALAEKTGFLERLAVPPQKGFQHCQYMNMIVIPYDNLYIGLLEVLYATAQVFDFGAKGSPRCDSPGQDGVIDVQLVCSRDLKKWEKPVAEKSFIPLGGTAEWDRSMIMPFSSNNIIRDGKQYLYYGGSFHSHRPYSMWNKPGNYPEEMQGLGLAVIRQDGFISIDAAAEEGILTTKLLSFAGEKFSINADARSGYIDMEILDENRTVIKGYERKRFKTIFADKVRHCVEWKGKNGIVELQRRPVHLRFYMKNAMLYTFTVEK
ncbi:MAG: hypothetical protein WC082_05765 [Victivallales bacterium]|jgi:hypothetical protein